jgi:hypothetical protein
MANRVVRFEASLQAQLKGLQCQDAFCCLGTTIRDAGSQAAFRAVDHDLVLEFAQLALEPAAPSAWWWCRRGGESCVEEFLSAGEG